MNELFEILRYTLPSLVVLATTMVMVIRFFNYEERNRQHQSFLNNQSTITPLRLQAYERAILFLERISPESLIMRVNKQGYTVQQLQSEILQTLRSEYEHNLTQQLYLSQGAWEMLKIARGRTIQMINTLAEKLPNEGPSILLSKAILESLVDEEKAPASDALLFIKKEFSRLF
jgi:hypothetical protein